MQVEFGEQRLPCEVRLDARPKPSKGGSGRRRRGQTLGCSGSVRKLALRCVCECFAGGEVPRRGRVHKRAISPQARGGRL